MAKNKACADRYGKSSPAWVTDLLCKTCLVCISKNKRKKQKAGHTPLLTRGVQARGQIDLIDMQSTPDGEFRFILSYRCHGTKFCWLEPLQSKEKKSVAWALFCIFTVLGPPKSCKQIMAESSMVLLAEERQSKLTLMTR
jgi:hypothetical protein